MQKNLILVLQVATVILLSTCQSEESIDWLKQASTFEYVESLTPMDHAGLGRVSSGLLDQTHFRLRTIDVYYAIWNPHKKVLDSVATQLRNQTGITQPEVLAFPLVHRLSQMAFLDTFQRNQLVDTSLLQVAADQRGQIIELRYAKGFRTWKTALWADSMQSTTPAEHFCAKTWVKTIGDLCYRTWGIYPGAKEAAYLEALLQTNRARSLADAPPDIAATIQAIQKK